MAYAPFNLKGKVALVTGGNRGIGWGMADAMAQAGADVAIWGRSADLNEATAKQLASHGVKAKGYTVDVSNETQVVEGMAQVVKDFGRIDTCVANAGIGRGAPSFDEMTTETYRYVLGINLDGVFWTLREACKHIKQRASAGDLGGSLMVVSSLAALDGAPRNQAYAATKGAVISMMKAIAIEYARYGVRANSILPGWIATDLTAGGEGFSEKLKVRIPARRWGEPEDFGGIAVYLASDASKYHSGDSFLIDGGYAIF